MPTSLSLVKEVGRFLSIVNRARGLTLALLFVCAPLAQAVPIVDFTWTDTTGTGTTGSDTITASPGDQLRLLLSVTDTEYSIFGLGVVLGWDGDDLTGSDVMMCPGPENFQPGICRSPGGGALGRVFFPYIPSQGQVLDINLLATATTNDWEPGATIHAFSMQFTVGASADFETIALGYRPLFSPGIGVRDGSGTFFRPEVSATVIVDSGSLVPIPGTLWLLGSGLLFMVFSANRSALIRSPG